MSEVPSPTRPRRRAWLAGAAAAVATMAALGLSGFCCKTAVPPRTQLSANEVRSATAFPFELYDQILHRYVNDQGEVNYQALRRERADLDRFLAFVGQAGPTTRPDLFPTANHRKAFHIAAYNATVFRNVIDRPSIGNIDDVKMNFFYTLTFPIDGRTINLYNLENDIIRPTYRDPRLHFALNCASASCPHLPNEAFVPDRVEEQLDREAREFVAEERNVRVVAAERKVYLSKIFDWYSEDFVNYEHGHGAPSGNQLTYINRYRAADAQVPTDYEMVFNEYDWTVNAQHAPGQPPRS